MKNGRRKWVTFFSLSFCVSVEVEEMLLRPPSSHDAQISPRASCLEGGKDIKDSAEVPPQSFQVETFR